MYFNASPLGNTPNIWEIHLDWSYFFTGYSRVHCNTEYIDYSLDSERITLIIGKIVNRSSEMAKIAIPAQEISKIQKNCCIFVR